MADGDFTIPTFPGVVGVGGGGHHFHNHGLEGKDAVLIASGDDATRDVLDANRDVMDAGRDVDMMSAIREEGGAGRAATERARADLISDVLSSSKENLLATLTASKENVQELLRAKSDLLEADKDTQILVVKEACETREAVHEEGNRTREVVREEARAILDRELTSVREENTLLKLQLNILSTGGGTPVVS